MKGRPASVFWKESFIPMLDRELVFGVVEDVGIAEGRRLCAEGEKGVVAAVAVATTLLKPLNMEKPPLGLDSPFPVLIDPLSYSLDTEARSEGDIIAEGETV